MAVVEFIVVVFFFFIHVNFLNEDEQLTGYTCKLNQCICPISEAPKTGHMVVLRLDGVHIPFEGSIRWPDNQRKLCTIRMRLP